MQLDGPDSVQRFRDNEDRFNAFINNPTGGYTASGGQHVDGLQQFLAFIGSSIQPSQVFNNMAHVAATSIASSMQAVTVLGWTVAGDMGGGLLGRVNTQPLHKARIQSADGQWWELKSLTGFIRPEQVGWAPGQDIGPAVQAMYDYCRYTYCKIVHLFTDPTNPGVFPGAYRTWSLAVGSTTSAIHFKDPVYNGILLKGIDRRVTRIEFDHAKYGAPLSVIGWSGVTPMVRDISFDGREMDRIPRAGLVLASNIDAVVTTIPIVNATNLTSTWGTFKIDNEYIYFDSKSGNNAINCQRGIRGTTAAAHTAGATITHIAVTGHHCVSMANFRTAFIRNIGSYNSAAYGIGVENSVATGAYIEFFDTDGIYIENAGSDGMDIKCPVQNGNKHAIFRNYTVKGWARETGWGPHSGDNGLDLRVPKTIITGFRAIYTSYMSKCNGINLRANQVNSGTPVGDFAGAHLSVLSDLEFISEAVFGTAKPSHIGIVSSCDNASINNITGHGLSGALFYGSTGDPDDEDTGGSGTPDSNLVSNLQSYGCFSGFVASASNCKLIGAVIRGSLDDGIRITGGVNNYLHNIDVQTSAGIGVHVESAGQCNCNNVKSNNNVGQDFVLNVTCQMNNPTGAVKTVTASYDATPEDYLILVDATGGPATISVPNPSQRVPGRTYVLRKIDASANAMIIDPAGAPQIEFATTKSYTARGDTARIQNNGSNWFLV